MITRITITNFMSHAATVIEPSAGLTALVGPNNCGKSAIVAALQTLAQNISGDFMVRHGEPDCSVTVETDDGHELTWRRAKNVVSYEIDGEQFHRLGKGGVPDALHEHLKLPRVETEASSADFDIHFGTQKEPIFLIDRPERDAALFFASSSDAKLLLEMQQLHKRRVTDTKRSRQQLVARAARLEHQLDTLAPTAELEGEIAAAEVRHAALLRGLADADRLARLIADLRQRASSRDRQQRRHAALAPLADPPAIDDEKALARLIDEIADLGSRDAQFDEREQAFASLEEPPIPRDDAPLTAAVTALREQAIELERRTAELARTDQRLAASAAAIEEFVAVNPTCPTCGGAIDPVRLIAGGHDHG